MNLTDKIFHDDEAARRHLEKQRWPNGAYCPHCGEAEKVTELQGKSTRPGTYICKSCRTKFTVTVGTIFERSHIGLAKWMMAFRLMAASKKGVSAHQLHRMLGVTYKSAWFMAHRIREAMRLDAPGPLGGEGKTVEADETYVGGKEKNKHRNKRTEARGNGPWRMQAVVTLVERNGAARSFHVANVTAKTLGRVIRTTADRKSHLRTDGATYYVKVGREFTSHQSVDHYRGEYGRGEAHSNTVENYFSILKRGITGTFHHVSEAHLHRYLAEFDFRYSNREGLGVTDAMRTDEMLKGSTGKRLTYRRIGEGAHA